MLNTFRSDTNYVRPLDESMEQNVIIGAIRHSYKNKEYRCDIKAYI